MMRVFFYTKQDCSLCEATKAMLAGLQREYPHQLIEIDVEDDASLQAKYGQKVPVVQVGPYTLAAPIEEQALRVSMSAARDSSTQAQQDQGSLWGLRLNKGLLAFARHWLAVFNLIVFSYIALPFLAPVLMKAGAPAPARLIYSLYSPFCHQLAFRSWFLFGEQPAYPRELAGSSSIPFGQATGIDEEDYVAARAFRGNQTVGYKVALCQRDIAIYGGIFLAGLSFSLLRKRIKALPIGLWFLLGVIPIALDGGSQLLSVFPWIPIPARESTPVLRTLTGALFGVMNVWMAYPYIEESMQATRQEIAAKLAIVTQRRRQLQPG